MIVALVNLTESVEKKLTRVAENIKTRVEEMENVTKSSQNMTDSRLDALEKKPSVLDVITNRLDVLENKTNFYDSLNITRINKTLTNTRNTVLYYHPEAMVVTKADGYHAGNLTKLHNVSKYIKPKV